MGLPLPDLLFMTWRSLTNQWLRSSLTAFGVFMGVGAVSATLNIQTITREQIDLKLAERDQPFVSPWIYVRDGPNPELDEAVQQSLKNSIAEIRAISSISNVYSLNTAQYEAQEAEIRARSVSLNYLDTTGRRMLQGRFFDQGDVEQYRPVALIDEQLAVSLFEGQSPLNRAIYADGNRLVIIGVMESKSNSEWGEGGELWMTETFATVLSGGYSWNSIQISAHSLTQIGELSEAVDTFLRQSFPQAEVHVWSNADDLLEDLEVQKIASAALTGVGLIALVIGGVGIANITVAAVLERTKEIGIRRAIGASKLEVMGQFVLEAVILSLFGGAIAVATVHGLTRAATTVVIEAPYRFSPRNAALSMGAAVAVGVGASFIPALRATQVDIVKALRSD
ncbi:abc-type antimicrobial peptide transport permease component [Leptolyngbya sp. Heron Island J]|uniref:ABC transporter permease n=1 Tax=Leptolyngbya sp. Heron Island J TaxID=1385935 RepID=UPI0003B9C8E8|nr:ABC transporter permease [Leptolyngbya sp. Heron Island J]ESA32024.1 abc-type antimicrobial peptide transport permease component [Leptolyngbya sp. Heron Island J]